MAWTIELSDRAERQLGKLDKPIAKRITRFLRERVAPLENPRDLGESLTGNLDAYWKYRVGAFRIICELQDKRLVVSVVKVGHRKEVYH